MNLFDSVCHAFCTMPTGGFSTKNTSLAHYNSAYFDFVIVIFMLLAGINFSLHFRLLKGDLKIFGRDAECRVFLILVGVFILLVTLDIYAELYSSLFQAFRYAAFQVSSIITTTGFCFGGLRKMAPFFTACSADLHVFGSNGRFNRRRHKDGTGHTDGKT